MYDGNLRGRAERLFHHQNTDHLHAMKKANKYLENVATFEYLETK
jgi:hypothetical protein